MHHQNNERGPRRAEEAPPHPAPSRSSHSRNRQGVRADIVGPDDGHGVPGPQPRHGRAHLGIGDAKDETTIFFGLSGAMVPAGMRPVIVHMIENRMIDVLVSTGANLYHDVYETLGFTHDQTEPEPTTSASADLRVVRFYDVLAPEHEFSRGERYCTEFAMTLEDGHPYTTREYFEMLGRAMAPVAREDGILTAAAEAGVPIYCPAFGDSVHGLAVAEGRLRRPQRSCST